MKVCVVLFNYFALPKKPLSNPSPQFNQRLRATFLASPPSYSLQLSPAPFFFISRRNINPNSKFQILDQESNLPAMFKLAESSLFGRKKSSSPFKNYYNEWLSTLKNTLLPQLRHALTSASSPTILATHVDAIHLHFLSYYEALDLEGSKNVAQMLYPNWRNSLEKPFIWLGDLHPYLFTNLLRSLLDDGQEDFREEEEKETNESHVSFRESRAYLDKPWHVMMAWANPSRELMTCIDQIECGLRLMVPSLVARVKHAQAAFVERVGVEWRRCGGDKEEMKVAIGEVMGEEMEELVGVFADVNRLRSSVLADILSATNIYQAAFFYEGLAQFLVGFHDQKLLREFHNCKKIIN